MAFNVAVGKCGAKPQRTLTIKYTFIRYVAWAMGETLSRTKVRHDPPAAKWYQRDIRWGATPKLFPKYPVATDTAMTGSGDNDTSLRSWRRTRQG